MKEFRSKRLRVWENISLTMRQFKVLLLGYRSYTALLTQTGTNPPVATVLENTLGLNAVFTYDAAGQYTLTDLSGLFLSNKTAVFMQFKNGGPTMEIYADNVNQIIIGTNGQDDVLLNTFIEIRIYN